MGPIAAAATAPRAVIRASAVLRKSFGGGLTGILDQGVVAFGSFAASVLVARYASVADFGAYLLLISLFTFLADLQSSVITSPYMIVRSRLAHDVQGSYRASVTFHGLALSVLTGVVALTMAFQAEASALSGISRATVIGLTLCLVAMLLRDQVRRLRIADLDLAGALRVDIVVTVVICAGMLGLIAFDRFALGTAVSVIAGACVLPCLVWIHRALRHHSFRASMHDLSISWRHGRWLLLSALVWAAVSYMYPWIIAYFHGLDLVGKWGAAYNALALCSVPIAGLQNYVGARILRDSAKHSLSSLRSEVVRWCALFGAIAIGFLLLYATAGDSLISLLFGTKYAGLGTLASLLALNLAFLSLNFCVSRGLFALGRANVDFAVNLLLVAFLLGVGLWLTAEFGVMGAAASICLSNALSLMVRAAAFFALTRPRLAPKGRRE
jgi:O-antigen/teichoic acid export membrane protein